METAQLPAPGRTPPGPSSWPLVGNVLDMRAAGDLARYFDLLWRTHGDVFRFKLFGANVIAITHPDALKHVLATRRDRYVKGPIYDSVRSVLGQGLVTLEGDAWKVRRALAQPAFHRQSLAKLTTTMARKGAAFFDGLVERAGGGSLEVDAHREMVKLTLDVVLAALLGSDLLRGSDVSYDVLGAALEVMSERTNGVVLPAWVPTPKNVKFRRTLGQLDAIMYALIGHARRGSQDDGSLLSMLLAARDADTGKPLTDREVRDEVLTLFLAGHETTALTLTWLLTFDGRPEVLARMRSEVDDVLAGRDPTFDDVAKLPYLRQVVEETLRLRPAAPLVPRNVIEDDVIHDYAVKRGEVVFLFFWGTHRHPSFWPDPERFDPDRFSPESSKDRHSYSFIPFSAGPRTCIGNMFALVESSVLMAQLLNRFDVEVLPCHDVRPHAMATMRPSRPVRIVLRPRGSARRAEVT